jgi:hypothetical protein
MPWRGLRSILAGLPRIGSASANQLHSLVVRHRPCVKWVNDIESLEIPSSSGTGDEARQRINVMVIHARAAVWGGLFPWVDNFCLDRPLRILLVEPLHHAI